MISLIEMRLREDIRMNVEGSRRYLIERYMDFYEG